MRGGACLLGPGPSQHDPGTFGADTATRPEKAIVFGSLPVLYSPHTANQIWR